MAVALASRGSQGRRTGCSHSDPGRVWNVPPSFAFGKLEVRGCWRWAHAHTFLHAALCQSPTACRALLLFSPLHGGCVVRSALFSALSTIPGIPPTLQAATTHRLVEAEQPRALKPFVVTPRVQRLWEQLLLALHVRNEHILVVGSVGCGKTETLRALCTLLQQNLDHVYLTPETETAELVGQLVPNTDRGNNGDRFVFRDGPVTRAVRDPTGRWVLADDINTADAAVMERLNPVLEQPPHWVVTENNEAQPLTIPPQFRVLATMTPPTPGHRTTSGKELSPAMSNRFTSVFMEAPPATGSYSEFEVIANVLLPASMAPTAARACSQLWEATRARNTDGVPVSQCVAQFV